MYGWAWRHLPGPWPVRLLLSLALVLGVVALLFYVIFPAADPHLPFNQVTPDSPAPSATATAIVTTPATAQAVPN